jgi:hypothetical protein
LLVSGIPVCVTCDLAPEKTLELIKANLRLNEARAKWRSAKLELTKADEIRASLPSGHPDGNNTNTELAKAGQELQDALAEYLKVSRRSS